MKYMGSKARLAKDIYTVMEPALDASRYYIEPFAGGMNMVGYVNSRFDGVVIANDSHEYLIAMWDMLLKGWEPPSHVSKEQYYEIKGNLDRCKHLSGWVGFNCSYAGKWFDGYAGITETKAGIRDYQKEAIANILKQIPSLDGITLRHGSYSDLVIPDGSVVYCDPPYSGTRKYRDSFNSHEFWEWVRILSLRCKVYVSEYSAPDDFVKVWSKAMTSSLSANQQSGTTTKSVECLFVHRTMLGG